MKTWVSIYSITRKNSMGVPLLNRFIKDKHIENPNENCIEESHFKSLSDKTVVVDMLIYMYRFKSENLLFEKIYELCCLFIHYNINAVFIFDGKMKKMNEEKKKERYKCKDNATTKYDNLYKKVSYLDKIKRVKEIKIDSTIISKYKDEMKDYISTKTKITSEECKNVRHLIRLFGFKCIRADTEADILCCYYVNTGKAYGCFTEDMDLLVYGCKKVFKYMSLVNHSFLCYNYENILRTIGLDSNTFRELCVLSGSEYKRTQHNIYFIYKTMKRYNINRDLLNIFCDYDCIKNKKNTEPIQKQYKKLKDVLHYYNLDNHPYLKYFDEYCLSYDVINNTKIEEFLRKHNFIFV